MLAPIVKEFHGRIDEIFWLINRVNKSLTKMETGIEKILKIMNSTPASPSSDKNDGSSSGDEALDQNSTEAMW